MDKTHSAAANAVEGSWLSSLGYGLGTALAMVLPVTLPEAIAKTVLALAVYGALYIQLGFILSTALAVLAIGRLYEGSWVQSAVAAVGLSLGLYVVFEYLLDVPLPRAMILGG